ncbi:nucleotidyltransferase family protein [Spirulina sp. CS-785/01]|uniref:nucleotidyltransferase family protein n=1 Tax=Spirulina sp. CS-785/01 TaxID=3021716 RepID=UPI0023306ED6|nr:nucleotidyltransferase family protein [Spirulina sp. CS-785/01]MDB9312089.1 nucleotidyltransferase family protein [Spirulina sp. CS-785/01]
MNQNLNSQIIDQKTVLSTLKNHSEDLQNLGVKSLSLFGSTARNEATPDSDLDFLVEFNAELTFKRYMKLKFFLEDLFNKNVDLVIKTDLKPQIRESVIKESIYVT